MITKDMILNNLLKIEVAKKGQTATLAFFGFVIFSFIYGFGCVRFLPLIRFISLCLFLLTIVRYFLYKKIIEKNSIDSKEWITTVVLITLNGLGYGVITFLASFELKLGGVHFVVATTLMAGLVGSSIVSLAYFPILFIPFQCFLLLPQIGIIIYYYYAPEHLDYSPLIVLYLMYFFYQLKQYQSYRKDLIQLFNYQLELEAKNKELNDSKNIIIEKTTQLVHASRLAVVGEMSAGIAHEINNPLTIISSCAQMLDRLTKADKIDNDVLSRYSDKINKSVERISSIIKGLKYFTNQADRSPKKNCKIQDIIEETTPFCIDHLRSLDIEFKVDEIPQIMINCHAVQISQVLINLLKNASDEISCDSTEENRWISINFKTDYEYFYFMVSNGGEKISREAASRVFNPFYTTKETGTGLGLSISQTIMQNHGGELYLDMSNNENTTFVIKHPIENYLH